MDPFLQQLLQLRRPLQKAARARLRNIDWADDAVSETLLAALEKRPAFDEPARVRAWLFGVLAHKVVDQMRRHLGDDMVLAVGDSTDLDALLDFDPGSACDPQRRLGARQFVDALTTQLHQLPPPQARAFMMREAWGSSTEDICNELSISAGHLWVMLHRVRGKLRRELLAHR